jgi:hypothetical protein
MAEYRELLKDVRWQKLRLRCLELSGWKCSLCGAEDKQLHVHHRVYIKGKKPWEYEESQLHVLCEKHHSIEHFAKDLFNEVLLHSKFADHSLIAAALGGFLFSQNDIHPSRAFFAWHLSPAVFRDVATSRRFGMSESVYEEAIEDLMQEARRYISDTSAKLDRTGSMG